MKPAPFEYHAPSSVAEAVGLLTDLGEDAKVLAGGQSLIPMLALRLTAFEHLVDIGGIGDMRGVRDGPDAVWVGAATTEAAVGSSAVVAGGAPLLARATPLIGHFQIRNRGTIGGSMAHADPAAEYPAVALALGAEMEVASAGGPRSIPAVDFFAGHWTTTMEPEEILTGITFPKWGTRAGFAIEEFARRDGDFAIAGAAVAVQVDEEECVTRSAISLFGMGSVPIRAGAAEHYLDGMSAAAVHRSELGRLATEGLESVPSDLHGSSAYRRRVAAVMVERAWDRACREAISGEPHG